VVPSGTMEAPQVAASDPNRLRLVEGMFAAIEKKGYAATTIADIVRYAQTSKRTFYEHFADKDECLLVAFAAAADEMLRLIATAVEASSPSEDRVRVGVSAYVQALEARPALARTFLLDIYAAGPRVMDQRREVHRRFADALRRLASAARKEHPEIRPLTPAMATALVGGINELVLVALESSPARLRSITETAVDLVSSVLLAKS